MPISCSVAKLFVYRPCSCTELVPLAIGVPRVVTENAVVTFTLKLRLPDGVWTVVISPFEVTQMVYGPLAKHCSGAVSLTCCGPGAPAAMALTASTAVAAIARMGANTALNMANLLGGVGTRGQPPPVMAPDSV